ncbi:GNAT family N-acetyltransferase [Pseudoroseicyclus tamaricis]|uniref:L-ornithine N(alpha)-acyltransferase n=1 Tax=Pseudoroseicyclus tamaricis TaxID=2705421 RepID=A0A6B2JRK5_9RHOB|nr:GNAT family N-acyltransferase [Pseudoroseicyclus tamaricis]NDV00620.1 GNAT family N-acetyltransferase [Pseudoroseicyclus tamaricis]
MDTAKRLDLRLATCESDRRAAARLRYEVFVEELGGDGPLVDHCAGEERDAFDPHCDHMVVVDPARPEGRHVIGLYRLLGEEGARAAGGFYSEGEFDLAPLRRSGRRLLELGRSCLHRDYRGGAAMFRLWQGLGAYVAERKVDLLFGTASFHGTDPDRIAGPLTLLHNAYLAPEEIRVRSRAFVEMDRQMEVDRRAAMIAMPALIKGYLRLGGHVGEGAFIDKKFNTTDICLLLDTGRLSERALTLYGGGGARR